MKKVTVQGRIAPTVSFFFFMLIVYNQLIPMGALWLRRNGR